MDLLELFSKTLEALHREGPYQSLERFQDWAFDLAKAAVKFDCGFWGTGAWSPDIDAPIVHNMHLHRLPESMTAAWEAIKTTDEDRAFTGKVLAANGASVVFTPEDLAGHPLYPRYGARQMVTSYVQDPKTGLFDVVSFYRSELRPAFGEAERRLHQALVPHLLHVEREVRLRHLDSRCRQCTAGQDGEAVADKQGMLRLAQPNFVKLIAEEWPSWHGPKVPEALFGSNGYAKSFIGRRAAIKVARQHDMFVLSARPLTPADTLSAREREAADHWRKGHSHKQIAAAMGISPATVRNHLARAYEKLGISNRVQLAQVLGLH